jgi:di/tricarboxylate transporter
MQETGGATVVADILSSSGAVLPLIGVLLLIVVITGLFANVITPVATVVLMVPVAVDAAAQLGANEFAFLLGVMFASASSFITPVGYQTNLRVYESGGYRFTDVLRVGEPLQFLIAVVITVDAAFFWGLTPG